MALLKDGTRVYGTFNANTAVIISTLNVAPFLTSAYTQANTATTNAATADSKAVTAGSYANSAYTKANGAVQLGFTTYSSNGISIVPTSNNDTIIITPGNGVSISACTATKTITISSSGAGTGITTGKAIAMAIVFG